MKILKFIKSVVLIGVLFYLVFYTMCIVLGGAHEQTLAKYEYMQEVLTIQKEEK